MKMSVENRARLAFAMVVMLGGVAVLAWYLLTSTRYTTYQILTRDSVSGLIADAPVEFHGVEVGKVRSVELVDPHTVSILLNIAREAPVTTATSATITSRGLATRGFTGYVYISLEDTGAAAQPLASEPGASFPRIATSPSRSVNLDTALSQVNQNVQQLTELMQSLLDKQTITSFKQSVDGLQQVTRMLAENNNKLRAIIVNTEQASHRFTPLLESSSDTVKALQFQLIPEAYRTIDKLEKLSDSLNSTANKINREPSILLRGSAPPPPGPGEIE